ncbi:hypothetical protein T11_14768 [Trichinella zimbabwensis]|uniref:Uncharacterized protein n=1 Tax=Trichinella zimbabwensis TaxID=268475 RepID=A0A0V1GU72_9BILA|nr:hypothetical protein T11_14768 [Trichinella zimbabwensis]
MTVVSFEKSFLFFLRDAFPGTGLSGDRDSGIHKTPTLSRCSERSRRYVKIRATPGKSRTWSY